MQPHQNSNPIKETYSLFELNGFIKRVISLNFDEAIWVRCELSQVNNSRGHYYLNLIEKDPQSDQIIAQSSAVIWRNKVHEINNNLAIPLDDILKEGQEVAMLVQVDFHERYGMKLVVNNFDTSYTLGKLALKRQQTIAELKKLKLLDVNGRLPLPEVIQSVAIISGETAAGFQDFCRQLQKNPYGYGFKARLFQAAMQGQNVEEEVGNALKQIDTLRDEFDVVVVIRGGGSRLDLSDFDSFALNVTAAAIISADLRWYWA